VQLFDLVLDGHDVLACGVDAIVVLQQPLVVIGLQVDQPALFGQQGIFLLRNAAGSIDHLYALVEDGCGLGVDA
jgi:hypothetical protein